MVGRFAWILHAFGYKRICFILAFLRWILQLRLEMVFYMLCTYLRWSQIQDRICCLICPFFIPSGWPKSFWLYIQDWWFEKSKIFGELLCLFRQCWKSAMVILWSFLMAYMFRRIEKIITELGLLNLVLLSCFLSTLMFDYNCSSLFKIIALWILYQLEYYTEGGVTNYIDYLA